MPSISGGSRAGVVAGARVFDLDDLGAQLAQQHSAHRAGEEAGQVEDAGLGEGEHGWSLAWVAVAWQCMNNYRGPWIVFGPGLCQRLKYLRGKGIAVGRFSLVLAGR